MPATSACLYAQGSRTLPAGGLATSVRGSTTPRGLRVLLVVGLWGPSSKTGTSQLASACGLEFAFAAQSRPVTNGSQVLLPVVVASLREPTLDGGGRTQTGLTGLVSRCRRPSPSAVDSLGCRCLLDGVCLAPLSVTGARLSREPRCGGIPVPPSGLRARR